MPGTTLAPEAAPQDGAIPSVFRPKDLVRLGLSPDVAAAWVRSGKAVRLSRGLYRLTDYETTELMTIAEVAAVVPGGVICLLSALRMHAIGTESPPDVWIAIDGHARRPATGSLPVRVVRFSPAMMRYGIEDRVADGVPFRVTSPARTVIDCFRYRRKIGLSVAIEALRDALATKTVTVSELLRAAEVGRVRTVMLPYLDTVLA
jgi:predicted transcriptional regulator of viral defense system